MAVPHVAVGRTGTLTRSSRDVDTRTDYALVSAPLGDHLSRAEIIDIGDASDHNPVVITLD